MELPLFAPVDCDISLLSNLEELCFYLLPGLISLILISWHDQALTNQEWGSGGGEGGRGGWGEALLGSWDCPWPCSEVASTQS